MRTVVIVGLNVREAQSLAMERREQDKGSRVLLLSPDRSSALLGLRPGEVIVSPNAHRHPKWPQFNEKLRRAQMKIGAPATSD